MRSLCPLAPSSNYDLILITETWLNYDTPDDETAIPGHQSFRKIRSSQREGDCLVHVRSSTSPSFYQDLQLNGFQDAFWLRADICWENLMWCAYCPPGPRRSNFLLLNDPINYPSTTSCPKIRAGDFDTADICWPNFTAPNSLPPLLLTFSKLDRYKT